MEPLDRKSPGLTLLEHNKELQKSLIFKILFVSTERFAIAKEMHVVTSKYISPWR